MNEIDFKEEINKLLNSMDMDLDDNKANMYYKYMRILQEWNEKVNLTAIIEDNDIILKHFVDSLTINKYIKDNNSIIDVGTGAGFPGIPLSIYNNTVKCTLLDSLNKRILFLDNVISQIGITNIQTIHGRAEDIANNRYYREKYDVSTARAVASIETLVEYLLPFVKVGGICICMKSNDIKDEIENSRKAIEILGGEIIEIDDIMLPNSDIVRKNVIVKKVKKTPIQYPRKAGTPKKEPIR